MANIVNQYGQVKVGVRVQSSGGGGNDADAQAFITAASITDNTQKSAINTLVTSLKSANIWTKMKAIYPFVGGTATSHKFNLKDPRDLDAAFRLVFAGGGTHSSTGYQLNGSNSWGDTKLIPSTTLSAGNISLGFYSRTNRVGANKVVMGTFTTPSSGFNIFPRYTDNKAYFSLADDGNVNTPTPVTSTLGFYQGARNNSTTQSLSNINGNNYSYTYNTVSLPNTSMFIGSINYFAATYVDSLELAFSYIGENLSAVDMGNYYTAVQTFQTTLGRQVGVPIVADTDAQAFLNAAVITNQTQANAINTLVTDLKSANIWTKMKAIYPFVGGTATSHKFNLKDPRDLDAAYRLVFSGGWTHTSTGALPNGTTGYADTKLVPSTNLSTDSHISIYLNTLSSNSQFPYVMGSYNGENQALGIRTYGNSDGYSRTYHNSQLNASNSISTSNGLWVSNIITGQQRQLRNNVLSASGGKSGTNPTLSTYIGAINSNNAFNTYASQTTCLVSMGDALSLAEETAFYNAVQAYQTTLGRQV